MNQVTIVGGGDAGLMTGLILRAENPDLDITIVDNFEDEPAEVGKSTITYILGTFHDFLDIDRTRFVREVKPIWKMAIYFRDWLGTESFYFPFDGFTLLPPSGRLGFETLYWRYAIGNFHTPGVEIAEQNKSPFIDLNQVPLDAFGLRTSNARSAYANDVTAYDHVAYHLSTNRLNEFLRRLCKERDIELTDDKITRVDVQDGKIRSAASDDREYHADLFVDASGFNRTLMSRLDNRFREFDFHLDSAFIAKADISLSEIEPATVIDSGEHGWFWQIDTIDGRDLGYVYSSDHVSDPGARREFLRKKDELNLKDDVRHYRFDSGVYKNAWVNNCVAVGNALGFVEPLHSTALTVNAMLVEKLSEILPDHRHINHQGIRNIYNKFSDSLWDNVYDFISLHYRFSRGEGEFWNDMADINEEEHLQEYTQPYNENGFASHHVFGDRKGPSLRIFNYYHFYLILRHLGVESNFYENAEIDVSQKVNTRINMHNERIDDMVDEFLTYEEVYGEDIFG